jgi:hypothetical protein
MYLARLYPFRPHSKAFRLGALRTLAALLPCPAPRASREKSPEPTTPFSPAQSHLRKLGKICGTTPPAGRLFCSAPFVGGRGGLRARTSPTAPGWCAGSPSPITAFASLSRDAAALPGRSSRSTNHNTPIRTKASSHPIIGLEGLLDLVDVVGKLSATSASEREEGSRCTSKERFPPASERRSTASAVAQAAAGQPSSPAVAAQSAAGAQARRRRDAGGGGGGAQK